MTLKTTYLLVALLVVAGFAGFVMKPAVSTEVNTPFREVKLLKTSRVAVPQMSDEMRSRMFAN